MAEEFAGIRMTTDLFYLEIKGAGIEDMKEWNKFHGDKFEADCYLYPVHINHWAIARGFDSSISARFGWRKLHWWIASVLAIWIYGVATRAGVRIPWWDVIDDD